MAERKGFEPLVRFLVHTLSKRAPSTTRTSLRLESAIADDLVLIIAKRSFKSYCSAMRFVFSGLRTAPTHRHGNCVRPPNVVRSLTALGNSWVCLTDEAMEPVVPLRGMAL